MDLKNERIEKLNLENDCMNWILLSIISITCGILLPIIIPLIGFIFICFFFILDIIRVKKSKRLILENFCNEFFSLYYSFTCILIIFGRFFIIAFDFKIISLLIGLNFQFLFIFLSIIIGLGDILFIELVYSKKYPKIGLEYNKK